MNKSKGVGSAALLQVIFLLTFAFTIHTVLNIIERYQKDAALESLQGVLRTVHEAMQIWIELRGKNLSTILHEDVLHDEIVAILEQAGNKERHARLDQLITKRLEHKQILGYTLINPDFQNVASNHAELIGLKNIIAEHRPEFLEQVFSGNTVFVPTIPSEIPLADISGRVRKSLPNAFFVSPIRTDAGVVGAFAIRINPVRQFTQIARLGKIGRSGETYAFDQSGFFISESRFEDRLENMGILPVGGSSILTLRLTVPEEQDNQAAQANTETYTRMAQEALQGHSGFDIKGYKDYRGTMVYGAWLWNHDLGFGLATEIDAQEALKTFHATRLTILLTAGLLVLLSILVWVVASLIEGRSRQQLKRLNASLESRVRERTNQLSETQRELEILNQELAQLATTDALTGIANRRQFNIQLEQQLKRARREGITMTVLLMDIDYFKKYNDGYGHQAGDSCLAQIARLISNSGVLQRPDDLVARYGGEEFAAIITDASEEKAFDLAQKICASIRDAQIPHDYTEVAKVNCVTMSIGVHTETELDAVTAASLIEQADQALYCAKAQGRNCVVASTMLTTTVDLEDA